MAGSWQPAARPSLLSNNPVRYFAKAPNGATLIFLTRAKSVVN